MTELRVRHHRVRASVPSTAHATAVRELAAGLPEAFAVALAERTAPGGVVCLRRVHTSVRLPANALHRPQATLRWWAEGLADTVALDLAHGGDTDAVAYRDHAAARADVVAGAARSDLRRRWAWEQAGVVTAADPTDPPGLLGAVLARPARDVAAYVGWLVTAAPQLLAAWRWSQWLAVARDGYGGASMPRLLRPATVEQPVQAAAFSSRLQDAPFPSAPLVARLVDLPAWRSLTALAGRAAAGTAAREERALVAALVLRAAAPDLRATPDLVGFTVAASERRSSPTADAPGPGNAADAGADPKVAPVARTVEDRGADEPAADGAPTAFGGLAFLLHLVRRLDLATELAEPDHPLAAVPLAATLVALGVAITGASCNDPGVLAFAGHGPVDGGEIAVAALVGPVPAPDSDAIIALHDLVVAALPRAALGRAPDDRPADVVGWVVRRPARVVAEPGWIELHLDARTADTDIRRAGLDLDLGWLPFLGCVVGFRYG